MRKTLIVFILSVVSTVCFAKPKSVEPDWFKNYRTVFPNAQYLAQRGSGTTAEDAKTDAASQLARYFQSTVSANLSTTMSSNIKHQHVPKVKGISEYLNRLYNELKNEKKWMQIR